MIFRITYSSCLGVTDKYDRQVELNTLEDFMSFVETMNFNVKTKENYDGIIIHPPLKDKNCNRLGNEWELEIYDSWRE